MASFGTEKAMAEFEEGVRQFKTDWREVAAVEVTDMMPSTTSQTILARMFHEIRAVDRAWRP
ncbi:hypothetical protein [Nocardia jejuensis]|uniref:hypothetical protein n=1 Tax=Nocardia jejuensis TaxID=328049 RepID=UPI0008361C2E|nr:hypothetical protein [Nocardia jejuensis]